MKTIPLTQGKFAIVDDEDYEELSQYNWQADFHHGNWYAIRNGRKGESKKRITMGRAILKPPDGMQVDHINHYCLDNQRINIRICTNAENQHNQKIRTGKTSKHKGVDWHKRDKRWRASIRCKSHRWHLGHYKNEEDAARAYDKKAKELHREYANLNFKR